jgi:hypothetical protein
MNYHEWHRRTHLHPADPDYIPEIDPEKLAEWVEKNIEDYATPEACEACGCTVERMLEEPYLLTESAYYERNSAKYEKDFEDAHPCPWGN